MLNKDTATGHWRRSAFTLIELMVVMLIIGLLASILVPSLGNVRKVVKTASSKTLIFNLEQAVNMFKSEAGLGNQYPPSYYHVSSVQDDPYHKTGSYSAWGAQTLVWAVVGARLTGTKPFDPPLGDHYDDTDIPSHGPFIDPSKLKIVKPNDPKNAMFDKLGPVNNDAPVILDAFNMPVLYYRPDHGTTSTAIHDMLPRTDNTGFTVNPAVSAITDDATFDTFFKDERAGDFGASDRPHNYDSFILLGAGADKKYGTVDDTANFTLNAQ